MFGCAIKDTLSFSHTKIDAKTCSGSAAIQYHGYNLKKIKEATNSQQPFQTSEPARNLSLE